MFLCKVELDSQALRDNLITCLKIIGVSAEASGNIVSMELDTIRQDVLDLCSEYTSAIEVKRIS